MSEPSLGTSPYNPRFPNTNQSKNCWANFVDFHRCVKAKGENNEECGRFLKAANALCPTEWKQKWLKEIETGTFPAEL